MSRLKLATTCFGLMLMSGAAMADHQGRGAAHIGGDVELGPRLTTRLESKLPEAAQAQAATETRNDEPEQATFRPAPPRKVRIVYPAP